MPINALISQAVVPIYANILIYDAKILIAIRLFLLKAMIDVRLFDASQQSANCIFRMNLFRVLS